MLHAALRCGAIALRLTCCAPMLGCAAPGPAGSPAAPVRKGYEGWYQGRQSPLSINAPSCRGRARAVWFEVENGAIEMRNAKGRRIPRKRGLLGTVSAEGDVAMRPAGGGRGVAGRIDGERLVAATAPTADGVEAPGAGGKPACAFRYEATRAASPIAERVPQP